MTVTFQQQFPDVLNDEDSSQQHSPKHSHSTVKHRSLGKRKRMSGLISLKLIYSENQFFANVDLQNISNSIINTTDWRPDLETD